MPFSGQVATQSRSTSGGDLSLDLDPKDISWQMLLLIVALLIVGSVVAVLRVQRLRELVLPALRDAGELLWSILRDPKRTFGLLGSNFAARAMLAGTLWFILHAIGHRCRLWPL